MFRSAVRTFTFKLLDLAIEKLERNIQIRWLIRLLERNHRFPTLVYIALSRKVYPFDCSRLARAFLPSEQRHLTTRSLTSPYITLRHANGDHRSSFYDIISNFPQLSQKKTYPGPSLITGWRVKRWYVITPRTNVVNQTIKLKNEKACAALHCPQ